MNCFGLRHFEVIAFLTIQLIKSINKSSKISFLHFFNFMLYTFGKVVKMNTTGSSSVFLEMEADMIQKHMVSPSESNVDLQGKGEDQLV